MATLPLALLVALAPVTPVPTPAADGALSLERIYSDPPLDGRAPQSLKLAPGGAWLSFLKPNEKDSEVLDLWGIKLGAADANEQVIVATADLLGGAEQKLTEQEKMALERKRISKRGITEYWWCGKSGDALLFPLSGDLYLARLDAKGGKPSVQRLTTDDDVPELDPSCDSGGAQLSFVKKGDVFVLGLDGKKAAKPKKLTSGAGDTRTFGLAEFIAMEEMGRDVGKWWSPDGKRLLVFEVDESVVGKKTRAQIFSDRTEMFDQRYPAAGEKNAVVTAWLYDVATAKRTKLATPSDDGYLPRGGFFPDGTAWVQWQSRDQKTLRLYEGPAKVGGALAPLRLVLEDKDAAWVELHDDLTPLGKDGARFLWTTEESGLRQIVIVDRKTGARAPFSAEPEMVDSVLAVDEDKGLVFFLARRDRGRVRHVFAQPLAGGASVALTEGAQWHAATFDDKGRFFVHVASDLMSPPVTTLRDATGRAVRVIDANPAAEWRAVKRGAPSWLDVTSEDGKTVLNALLLPPVTVEKGKRYPVITYVYGGPTGQTVFRGWQRRVPVWTHWTQRGYGVFLVDNRGVGGRDRAFNRAHKDRFNDVEVKDLFAAVAQLPQKAPWVDAARIGVFGWSYGGTLSLRALLDERSPFAAAASVAPVTDWSLYDTHYTERYVGVPKAADGTPTATYAAANLVPRAKLLARPLLLVHGTADDNVLFENTLRMTEALQKEGKIFDLMIYPGKAHGISGKQAQLHVYKTITAFFDEKLKP